MSAPEFRLQVPIAQDQIPRGFKPVIWLKSASDELKLASDLPQGVPLFLSLAQQSKDVFLGTYVYFMDADHKLQPPKFYFIDAPMFSASTQEWVFAVLDEIDFRQEPELRPVGFMEFPCFVDHE